MKVTREIINDILMGFSDLLIIGFLGAFVLAGKIEAGSFLVTAGPLLGARASLLLLRKGGNGGGGNPNIPTSAAMLLLGGAAALASKKVI